MAAPFLIATTTSPFDNVTDWDNVTSSNSTGGSRLSNSQWWFGQIFPIIIIVFGTIGNFCVIFVLSHQKYNKISTCYYMKYLAWSDNFVMFLLFIRWLSKVPGTPMQRDTAFCVLYFFFVRFGFGMSAWTLMFMTVDRFIAVQWPLKAGELCTIKRARISLFAIAIVHIVGHLPYFWRYSNPSAITLSQQCPYGLPADFARAYSILRMLIFDRLLPWLLTLGFTIAMSWVLYRDVKKTRDQLGADNVKTKEKLSRRVTAMSLIVSWVFFFLTFPTSIDYGIRVLKYFTGKMLSVSAFLYELWVYFLYLNSALNFYLYVLASGKFREDFRVMAGRLFGVAVAKKRSKGSLSTGSSSRRTDNKVSAINHASPSHVIQDKPSIVKSTEYQNAEFTHL